MTILPGRSFLQQQLAFLVENQHVNGPMAQVILMNFGSGSIANFPIVLVNNREALLWNEDHSFFIARPDKIRESNPLIERKFLGPSRGRDSDLFSRGFPLADAIAQ